MNKTARFLEKQKKKLLATQREIKERIQSRLRQEKDWGEELKDDLSDELDLASDKDLLSLYDQLNKKDIGLLDSIAIALRKMERGEYGECEGTGLPIERKRLDRCPWARFSLEYQQDLEMSFHLRAIPA